MDAQKVDIYMMTVSSFLPAECLLSIRERLLEADENKLLALQSSELKNPMTAFWFNFFLGWLGADYFYLGKPGLGIAKLLTCGGLGLWAFINLFTIIGTTKNANYQKIIMLL